MNIRHPYTQNLHQHSHSCLYLPTFANIFTLFAIKKLNLKKIPPPDPAVRVFISIKRKTKSAYLYLSVKLNIFGHEMLRRKGLSFYFSQNDKYLLKSIFFSKR